MANTSRKSRFSTALSAHWMPSSNKVTSENYPTDVGREVAEQIYEKHRFFTDRLIEAGVDPVTAEKDACRMEHVISQESFERLRDAYKTKNE